MSRLGGFAREQHLDSVTSSRRGRLFAPGIAGLVVAGVVLVAVLAGLALVLTRDDRTGRPANGSGATTSSEATSASVSPTIDSVPPTAAPLGPTGNAEDLPPALPAVPLDATAQVGNGISATLPSIEGIQGSGTGPGNVAGPALRVTVRIVNGTRAPVSLDGVAVNLFYGSEDAPASPLDDSSQSPFGGSLAAGETADGVYVFSVPSDVRDSVTVEMGYEAGAPRLLFTGPVS
jgi:hypothetical protein